MQVIKVTKNDFIISTDKSKLDVPVIHHYLSTSAYWAMHIPLATLQRSIENSCCFGLYKGAGNENDRRQQVGFARVITDHATFGYLADVFVLDEYQKQGLGQWLMQTILQHPDLQGFRSWMLATRDAHSLYARFGFTALEKPERFMRLGLLPAYPPGTLTET